MFKNILLNYTYSMGTNRIYFLGHQGWTGFFSQYSIYKYVFNRFPNDTYTVLVYDPSQLAILLSIPIILYITITIKS